MSKAKVEAPTEPSRSFRSELKALLNSFNMEDQSDTPDWILADYIGGCLNTFSRAVNERERWYSRSGAEGLDD